MGRAALALLMLAGMAAPGEAARYVLSYSGSAGLTPHTGGTVRYTDTGWGSFDIDDSLSTISLASGLTDFNFSLNRHTDYYTSSALYQFDSGRTFLASDLSFFSYDPSRPFTLSFQTAAQGGIAFRASGGSGNLQVSGGDVPSFGTFTFQVAAVPEPASWAMMVAGFGLVGWSIRRRTRRTATAIA